MGAIHGHTTVMNASKFCIIDLTYEEDMEQRRQFYKKKVQISFKMGQHSEQTPKLSGALKARHTDVASQQIFKVHGILLDNVLHNIENQMRNQS